MKMLTKNDFTLNLNYQCHTHCFKMCKLTTFCLRRSNFSHLSLLISCLIRSICRNRESVKDLNNVEMHHTIWANIWMCIEWGTKYSVNHTIISYCFVTKIIIIRAENLLCFTWLVMFSRAFNQLWSMDRKIILMSLKVSERSSITVLIFESFKHVGINYLLIIAHGWLNTCTLFNILSIM